jgi:protein tyrosine/serine phosphatase
VFKRHTRPLALAVHRARSGMETPGRRLVGWLESLFMDHALIRLVYANRHRISARMWRSAQPTPAQVRRAAEAGIRTIINLRGRRDCASYLLEREACARHGITLVDFPLDSREPPSRERLHGLGKLFTGIEYPALMHCKSGADRAGIGAALYLLLHEGRPVEEAMDQLHLRYGHLRSARTGVLDHFLQAWRDHAATEPTAFYDWVDRTYDPARLKAEFRPRGWANVLVDRVLRRE